MENSARSKRTREAAIQAALAIILRDGPARLTIDAIARESGISKGGVLHQFRTKDAVLKALLEHQITSSDAFFRESLDKIPSDHREPVLEAEIETFREAASHPQSATFAIAGALADSPELLAVARETDAQRVKDIKAQAADSQIALVRWAAAKGLALAAILGLCSLSEQERESLFDCLLDDQQWSKVIAGKGGRGPQN
jgi:AcrR family transcriptional regulator